MRHALKASPSSVSRGGPSPVTTVKSPNPPGPLSTCSCAIPRVAEPREASQGTSIQSYESIRTTGTSADRRPTPAHRAARSRDRRARCRAHGRAQASHRCRPPHHPARVSRRARRANGRVARHALEHDALTPRAHRRAPPSRAHVDHRRDAGPVSDVSAILVARITRRPVAARSPRLARRHRATRAVARSRRPCSWPRARGRAAPPRIRGRPGGSTAPVRSCAEEASDRVMRFSPGAYSVASGWSARHVHNGAAAEERATRS